MKTVKVTIGTPSLYSLSEEAIKDKIDELRHELASHFWAMGINESQLDGSDITKYGGGVTVICDDKAAMRLILAIGMHDHNKIGVKSVQEMFDTEDTTYDRMLEKLELTASRLTEAAAFVQTDYNDLVSSADKFNTRTQSHLTGNTLSSYNSMRLLEDCCTDALQSALDEGWRIVACCPQEARRPDYILGRYNPVHNPQLNFGAVR